MCPCPIHSLTVLGKASWLCLQTLSWLLRATKITSTLSLPSTSSWPNLLCLEIAEAMASLHPFCYLLNTALKLPGEESPQSNSEIHKMKVGMSAQI